MPAIRGRQVVRTLEIPDHHRVSVSPPNPFPRSPVNLPFIRAELHLEHIRSTTFLASSDILCIHLAPRPVKGGADAEVVPGSRTAQPLDLPVRSA